MPENVAMAPEMASLGRSMRTAQHPSQRFRAPAAIGRGVPLKDIYGPAVVRLIGESFATVMPEFQARRFVRMATAGLDDLELSQRARHIALALAEQLPASFSSAYPILLASLGPELTATEGNGLAPFFYWPHAFFIAERGIDDIDRGLTANYELTKRFTAEYSVRPFLAKHRDACLERLAAWTVDPNPHVRRLVSEGTRPRLPWAMRLPEFQKDPRYTLPLLERLKDDAELYVRRSVANHLADILKDHPAAAYEVCERWLAEVDRKNVPAATAIARRWIIRHAVRLPAKKGQKRAILLRAKAK